MPTRLRRRYYLLILHVEFDKVPSPQDLVNRDAIYAELVFFGPETGSKGARAVQLSDKARRPPGPDRCICLGRWVGLCVPAWYAQLQDHTTLMNLALQSALGTNDELAIRYKLGL